MNMALDEGGDQQGAIEIEGLADRGRERADRGDPAPDDLDIGARPVRQQGVAEPHQIIPSRRAATYL